MAKKSEKLVAQIKQIRQEPANKLCFDCGDRGPQYVCLPFSTFVCMTCSGLHREFNHRVKGINASEFTEEEVNALKIGGNEVAKSVWLARYTASEFPLPDASTPPAIRNQRLKEFMRLKYIDKRWVAKEKSGKKTAAAKPTKKTEKPKTKAVKPSDSDDDEKEPPAKPAKTTATKKPVVKQEPEESSDDDTETTKKKQPKPKAKPETKTKPKSKEKAVAIEAPSKKEKASASTVDDVTSGVDNILEFGSTDDAQPTGDKSAEKDDDWATFDSNPQPSRPTAAAQSEWSVFTSAGPTIQQYPTAQPTRPASFIDFQVTSAESTPAPTTETKTKPTAHLTAPPATQQRDFFADLIDETLSPAPTVSPPPVAAPTQTAAPASFMTSPMMTTPSIINPPGAMMTPTPGLIPPMVAANPYQQQLYQQQLYQQQLYQQQMYYYQLYLAQQAAQGLNPAGRGAPTAPQVPPTTSQPPSTTTTTSSSGTSAFDDLGFL